MAGVHLLPLLGAVAFGRPGAWFRDENGLQNYRKRTWRSSFLQEELDILLSHHWDMSTIAWLRTALHDFKSSVHPLFPVWLPVYTGTRPGSIILVTHIYGNLLECA